MSGGVHRVRARGQVVRADHRRQRRVAERARRRDRPARAERRRQVDAAEDDGRAAAAVEGRGQGARRAGVGQPRADAADRLLPRARGHLRGSDRARDGHGADRAARLWRTTTRGRAPRRCSAWSISKDAMHRRLGEYSKGMRQRAKLAQAMAHDPEVVFLDEPLTGCDPLARVRILEVIAGLAARGALRRGVVARAARDRDDDVADPAHPQRAAARRGRRASDPRAHRRASAQGARRVRQAARARPRSW